MLLSLALIIIIGFGMSGILNRLKIPGLLGMIFTGIILGPSFFNLISSDILDISPQLRQIALIVILTRAGLSIDLADLKKVGRPAILMCFIPATLEIATVTVLAPTLLNVSYLDGAIMGCVVAAVSPAVIVPRMIMLMEKGYGMDKSIPQLIMAGASVDDIYVIVLFTSFLKMAQGSSFSFTSLVNVPVSIVSSLALGTLAGYALVRVFKTIHTRDTVKVLVILSFAFIFVSLEEALKGTFPLSGLLAVMAMGAAILKFYEPLAKRIMGKFSKIWVSGEIILFVLVGAAVNIEYLFHAGFNYLAVILIALSFRILGVLISLAKTKLNFQERLFCCIGYLPKATVQAAIGAVPLAAGLESGGIILTIAVLAIIVTAPLGAIGVDLTYKRLLQPSQSRSRPKTPQ
ncbi:MAG: cation:proton antiporter [Erysipelotrichaceae bacterium]|nr:cation:proton antiporter [Erysipelotrichaceae bacterium]MDD3810181.1 cation:proton antiporter [Erysipelotrichaceae bacterium]